MFVAMNEVRERVFANKSLPKEEKYLCPICYENVRLRAGEKNAPHFAHITSCIDDFSHDMSIWHKEWQERFPLNNREIVIQHNGEVHRADVLCYGTVIEFQHSPISSAEFRKRNNFYTSAGYKVVWIFDLIDIVNSRRMWYEDGWGDKRDNGGIFRWKHPWRFFDNFLPQLEKNIDVFFQIAPFRRNPSDKYDASYLEQVISVFHHYKTPWSRFQTSYKVANYDELLEWLQKRWEQETHLIPNDSI